jgi:hypothetical protein
MSKPIERHVALPSWLVVLGSAAIAGHLLAVVAMVLAAPSGPWPSAVGSALSTPPQFAYSLNNLIPAEYLKSLGMTNDYHFFRNRPVLPGVSFEVRLQDEAGSHLATVKFPESHSNFWVRHRQSLLARGLADDQPVEPPQGEMIPAPNRSVPTVQVWDIAEKGGLELRKVQEHLVPRDRPVFRPSERSLLLARSYIRHLCRTNGAAKAELIRHTQEPIPPAVMFMSDQTSTGAFNELISNFGELPE